MTEKRRGLTPEEARNLKPGTMLTCFDGNRRALFDKVAPGREPSKTHGPTTWIYVNWPTAEYPGPDGHLLHGAFSYPCQDFEVRDEPAVSMVGVGAERGLVPTS